MGGSHMGGTPHALQGRGVAVERDTEELLRARTCVKDRLGYKNNL